MVGCIFSINTNNDVDSMANSASSTLDIRVHRLHCQTGLSMLARVLLTLAVTISALAAPNIVERDASSEGIIPESGATTSEWEYVFFVSKL